MRNWLSIALSKKGAPSDIELYSNLDVSFFTYLDYLTAYFEDEENPFTFDKLTISEFQTTYRYVLDAALSSLSHPNRDVYSSELTSRLPETYKPANQFVLSSEYLPPPMPAKYCSWIQELLNKEFPINRDISQLNIDALGYLISQAFIQGNPPRRIDELTEYEEKLVVCLAGATFMGFREATELKNFRNRSSRHLAQIVALTHILGIKFSVVNDLM